MDAEFLAEILEELRRAHSDTQRIEVKRASGGFPRRLHDSVSAFANTDGGLIILGIDERRNFAVSGIGDPSPTMDAMATVCEQMDPQIRAAIEPVAIDGKVVVVAEIPSVARDQRPCHRRDRQPWDSSFVRVADGNRRLTSYEVSLLLSNRAPSHHDVMAVTEASVADLDEERVSGFIARIRDQRTHFRDRSDEEVLRLLNVTRETDSGRRPTLAGLLALGSYPQQYVPQLNLTIVVYPTRDAGVPGPRGERFLDNRSIDGPIPVIVRDAISVLKRHMKQRSVVTGLARTDEWEYPEEVLREALVNALAHRDYAQQALGAQVQVELFPDRLVIRNPGGLYGPLRADELGLVPVPASSRNPALLRLLEDSPLEPGRTVCENRGSGIMAMRSALAAAGMEPPAFSDEIATFTVTFPNHTLLDAETIEWLGELDTAGLSRGQLTALALMRRGQPLTNQSFRAATGISDSRVATAQLQDLRRRGLVQHDGDRGASTYQISAAVIWPSAHDRDVVLTPMLRVVLESVDETPRHRNELARRAGLTELQVTPALRKLRDAGLVEMTGKPRSRNAMWSRTEQP